MEATRREASNMACGGRGHVTGRGGARHGYGDDAGRPRVHGGRVRVEVMGGRLEGWGGHIRHAGGGHERRATWREKDRALLEAAGGRMRGGG